MFNQLIKNGKNYIPIPADERDFKQLFKFLASAGAGRPVDNNGVPIGSWTPELLAAEISKIEGNSEGVDLRTVQLWFQDNASGISIKNIHWLARVFGCGDRVATSEWQAELAAANRRLSANRKTNVAVVGKVPSEQSFSTDGKAKNGFSLARWCEAVFSSTALAVPSTIFAVAAALIFLSYYCGNHSFIYQTPEGYGKQIGYVWTANWTLVFTVFFPAYFVFASNALSDWKEHDRSFFDADTANMGWLKQVDTNSYTFTLVFILLVVFAGGVQWMSVRLLPLLAGKANYTTDWGSLALEHPEVITVNEAIVFTGAAYFAMCLFFFAFYAVLILLVTMAQDFAKLVFVRKTQKPRVDHLHIDRIGDKLIIGIFRCTILGVMSVIVMKLQGSYMESYGANIITWYLSDMASVFDKSVITNTVVGWGTPNHLASLLCVFAVCFTFATGLFFVRVQKNSQVDRIKLTTVFGLLLGSYLSIGLFDGFTLLLTLAMAVATYAICKPKLDFPVISKKGRSRSVL